MLALSRLADTSCNYLDAESDDNNSTIDEHIINHLNCFPLWGVSLLLSISTQALNLDDIKLLKVLESFKIDRGELVKVTKARFGAICAVSGFSQQSLSCINDSLERESKFYSRILLGRRLFESNNQGRIFECDKQTSSRQELGVHFKQLHSKYVVYATIEVHGEIGANK